MRIKRLKQKIWQRRSIWIGATSVASIVIAMRLAGLLQSWEWAALDQFFRWRPAEPPEKRILIVGINESDLRHVGHWPVSDAVLAELLEKLKASQPRAIGLDLYRDLPVPPGTKALEDVFKSTPNLIGIEKKVEDSMGNATAPPPVLSQLGQVGANDVVLDADGKIRRGILFLTPKSEPALPSLGLSLALIYLERQGITPTADANGFMKLGKTVFVPFEENDGNYIRADAGGYQIVLNFKGAAPFETVSMTDVLKDRVSPSLVRDRIVLIGSVAPSLKDLFYTPYSNALLASPQQTPGVEIQAHLTSIILSAAIEGRPLLQTWSDPLENLWIFLWSVIGAMLTWAVRFQGYKNNSLLQTAIGLVVVAVGLSGITYLVFLDSWWIPVVPPLIAVISSSTVLLSYIAQLERQDKQAVMNLFGRHVSPAIAKTIWRNRHQILKQGRLLGRQMTATVLFADLKGFTTIAEQTDPETLMSWLNEYMSAMVGVIQAHGGIVDKFIGDAIMAVFGVPIPRTTLEEIAKDAIAAVGCAQVMASTLELLNQQWQIQGRPTAAMRVGIATGAVVTGSLGSAQRLNYTTIGDSVNVAARLESYDKSINGGICRILINKETYQHIQGKFPTKFIGEAQLKGRKQATEIYQVLL
ncbi:MAG: adenylate/guanylate cyclase domain-containing protein [Coleofasciculus sp. Co-bin14]|nr:adenylate/guanylate cyclase domain-containing protein [Coleofasciculus sp. Co-bin14]